VLLVIFNLSLIWIAWKYIERSPRKLVFQRRMIQIIYMKKGKKRELNAREIDWVYIDHEPIWSLEHNNMKIFLKNGKFINLEAVNEEVHREMTQWLIFNRITYKRTNISPVFLSKKKSTGFDQYTWMESKK
jgi:hypothetical protein